MARTIKAAYRVTSEPFELYLTGSAVVVKSDVPVLVGGELHCADYPHAIVRRGRVTVSAKRAGVVTVYSERSI